MIKNKKGWLRILEAFLAIVLLTGFFVFIYGMRERPDRRRDEIYEISDRFLEDISGNRDLRSSIVKEGSGAEGDVENYINNSDRMPEYLDYTIRICDAVDICGPDEYRPDMYSRAGIISADIEKYDPKKLRIFIWEKE